MKANFLFGLAVLSFVMMIGSCSISQDDGYFMDEKLQTKAIEEPEKKYILTITSNIDDEILLLPTINTYYPVSHYINEEVVFSGRYKDTLYGDDSVIVIPCPVKGKKWVGIEGDNLIDYDFTLDNEILSPYFEGYMDFEDVDIHLIYEDSIPYSGGGNTEGGGSHEGYIEDENTDGYMHFIVYYNRMRNGPNGSKQLIFKLHSGIYSPDTVEINPIYGSPNVIASYKADGESQVITTMTPESDYFVLTIPYNPKYEDKYMVVSIPEQRLKQERCFISGYSYGFWMF